jgi:hypothetical protein
VQKEKRWRVFRAGFSVEDGEAIYLYRAIESWMCQGILSLDWPSKLEDASVREITSDMRRNCSIGATGAGVNGAGMRHSLG